MNIFILDEQPEQCALLHADKHVVKMILEHAQLMCTAHHLQPNLIVDYEIPYKATHVNHPCAKWVRESIQNYQWLYNMTFALNKEYVYRYDKNVNHKSWDAIVDLPYPDLPDIGMTAFALAMPDECKIDGFPVASYRKYYNNEKQHLLKWKSRETPPWIKLN